MRNSFFQKLFITCTALFWNVVSFAQEKDIDINVKTDNDGGFLSANLLWVLLIVAVIVVLVIALSTRSSAGGHTHVESHHHDHH